MDRILVVAVFLLAGLMAGSCKNDDPVPEEGNTVVKLTVIDESGSIVPYIQVHVFKDPPTEANGKNPDVALATEETNDMGVVEISLDEVSGIDNSPRLYFTVLERPLDLEYRVLGSYELAVPEDKPATISDDLNISNRKLKYPYGYIPTVIDSKLAKDEYERWKSLLVRTCQDGVRVLADPSSETRVEAIGFGTILAAYADDQDTFDKLMTFYDRKRTTEANNMMAWLVTCDDIVDPGSATDGDIDVAFANIIAHVQWGGTYLNKAKDILNIIKENLIIDCTVDGLQTKVLGPGYSSGMWGGCGMTDIQYYTPGFFRVFAEVTGENIWNQLADDSYTLLNASAHPVTGLVPDWQTADGTPGPGGRAGHYGYDACRVPWRMSLDYLWNGNTEARQWCIRISDWAYGIGALNIVDGYDLDGTAIGEYGLNSAFLGGFTVALMTSDFEKVNNFSNTLEGLNDTYWFNLNTRVLYLFALTGNFWKPEL